jgi:hypothetical protein
MNLGGVHGVEVMATFDLDTVATAQRDYHSAIASPASLSLEIPESDDKITPDGRDGRHSSLLEDSARGPSDRRRCSVDGSDRADGPDNDRVFDVFTEDDGRTEDDATRPMKRARSSTRPLGGAQNQPPAAVAVKGEGAQMSGNECADRPSRGNREYTVHQVVSESGSEYEVTAITKLWLLKASVEPRLVRKYRAEQRAATRVRTRWSSRLRSRG